MKYYKVTRHYGLPTSGIIEGTFLHSGNDAFGTASDDTRLFGTEYIAVSFNESGLPFFTIPKCFLEEVPVTQKTLTDIVNILFEQTERLKTLEKEIFG